LSRPNELNNENSSFFIKWKFDASYNKMLQDFFYQAIIAMIDNCVFAKWLMSLDTEFPVKKP